ncbi:MAG: DNA polymerase III subunit delta [bacterium]
MSGKTVAGGESRGKATNAAPHGNVYLIGGDDEYQASARAREIVDALVPADQQALGLEIIEGRTVNADESMRCLRKCMEALQTMAFMGGGKVVWLRDADFFSVGSKARSADMQPLVDSLVALIGAGLQPGHKLLITMAKLDGRSALYKVCERCGEVLEFSTVEKPWEVGRQAEDVATKAFKKAGATVGRDTVQALVERAGYDTRQITNEVEKLMIYAGARREVTRADVLALVPAVRETAAWDFADTVMERDLSKASRVLRQLIFQKEAPIGLVAGLEKRVALLIVLRTALDRGWLKVQKRGSWADAIWKSADPAMEKALGCLGKDDPRTMKPFRVCKLAEQAERFAIAELVKARGLVGGAREQLVSSGIPGPLVLELLLIAILGKRPL